jgi:hypothetical protein
MEKCFFVKKYSIPKFRNCIRKMTDKDLRPEYFQWLVTLNLRTFMHKGLQSSRDTYEADNILERWLLTSAQEGYPILHLSKEAFDKLLRETQEKKINLDEKGFRSAFQAISDSSSFPFPKHSFDQLECWDYKTAMTRRLRQFIDDHGIYYGAKLALRYDSLLARSQHWGLPQSHFEDLYHQFGVRNEAFASAFNSRLLGKPGAFFCSLFPDLEARLGSRGNFFEIKDFEGNWEVNPPFIEKILEQAAKKILNWFDEGRRFRVFFLMPSWTDTPAYLLLDKSKYRVAKILLQRGKYSFQLPDETLIKAPVNCYYFGLSSLCSETESSSLRSDAPLSSPRSGAPLSPPRSGAPLSSLCSGAEPSSLESSSLLSEGEKIQAMFERLMK